MSDKEATPFAFTILVVCKLRALYGLLYADVDKSVWALYEDGLMTFYTSN